MAAASVRRAARFTVSPVTVYSRWLGAAGAACHDLAAGNADMHADRTAQLGRELRHRVADGERGAHGALGIVAVSDGRAEHGHDAVADVLVDGAAVVVDDAVDAPRRSARSGRETSSASSSRLSAV